MSSTADEVASGTTAVDDDRFHEPTSDDPMWTETCWFAFFVPERSLSGTLYPLFRRNLDICSSGVHIWDGGTHEPYRLVYNRHLWHLPFPSADLTDVTLESGLRYERLEPAKRFRMSYEDGDEISLDLTFDGVIPPHYIGPSHLDQPGRVQGTLRLHGEDIAVDCLAIRDRSWSVRDDLHGHPGRTNTSYSYGMVSPADGFQGLASMIGDHGDVRAGYVIRDGEVLDVVGGQRHVLERKDGYQTRVAMRVEDSSGQVLEAEGECQNVFAWQFNPSTLSWITLVKWEWDKGSGWGEDHDNWSNSSWRAFERAGYRTD